jgi:hypothetical protein
VESPCVPKIDLIYQLRSRLVEMEGHTIASKPTHKTLGWNILIYISFGPIQNRRTTYTMKGSRGDLVSTMITIMIKSALVP